MAVVLSHQLFSEYFQQLEYPHFLKVVMFVLEYHRCFHHPRYSYRSTTLVSRGYTEDLRGCSTGDLFSGTSSRSPLSGEIFLVRTSTYPFTLSDDFQPP